MESQPLLTNGSLNDDALLLPSVPTAKTVKAKAGSRLASIDIIRGLIMCIMVGGTRAGMRLLP